MKMHKFRIRRSALGMALIVGWGCNVLRSNIEMIRSVGHLRVADGGHSGERDVDWLKYVLGTLEAK